METERIALSQRERDRLRVLHEVEQGHLAQIEAARRMKLTDRQVRRLLRGLRERSDRVVLHGLRGRPCNRKLEARFAQRVIPPIPPRSPPFGPTLSPHPSPPQAPSPTPD